MNAFRHRLGRSHRQAADRTPSLRIEPLERRYLLAGEFQNPENRFDVDANSLVSPLDVLRIINELNSRTVIDADGRLPENPTLPVPFFWDVNGDNFVTVDDVNEVLGFLDQPLLLDFGDAPTASQSGLALSYPTSLADNGARHRTGPLFLGASVDFESNGSPSVDASGDDTTESDDEDGVVLTSAFRAGTPTPVAVEFQVTASASGVLDGWFDFNRDGVWDESERVLSGVGVSTGASTVGFDVPTSATPGDVFARFRLTSEGIDLPTGMASDGEVEDYVFTITGDISTAPAFSKSFSPDTIDVGGTSTLTFTIDNSASAEAAISLDFSDTFPAGIILATPSLVTTTCTGGTLIGVDGSSLISYSGGTVSAGATCTVSAGVTSTTPGTHVNTSGDLTSSLGNSGGASDTLTVGEPVLLDFGDAPTSEQSGFAGSYPTELPIGARHTSTSLFLGASVDSEADGQPSAAADGDGGDEDGVSFVTSVIATTASPNLASVLVTATEAGKLDAWIDFNRDGDWDDAGEQLFTDSVDLNAGPNLVSFVIPAGAGNGETYARFRLSTAGVSDPSGPADDGEVEDYRITILDGDSPVPAEIDLIVGSIDVTASGMGFIAEHEGQQIFRVPGTALSSHAYLGTGGDDQLRVGNLTSVVSTPIPFTFDGGDGLDSVTLTGTNQELDLTDAVANSLANIEVIDIIGASPNSLTLDGVSVTDATDGSGTLLVIHDEDDTVSYAGQGWDVQDPEFIAGGERHVLVNGSARVETINTLPFQNPLLRFDVNHSEMATSLDALLIINFIGRSESTVVDLPAPTSADELPENYYDVNGSQTASALDALQVINYLAILSNGENEQTSQFSSPQEQQAMAPVVFVELTPSVDYPSPEIIHDVVLKLISLEPAEVIANWNDLLQQFQGWIPVDLDEELQAWQLALEELLDEFV